MQFLETGSFSYIVIYLYISYKAIFFFQRTVITLTFVLDVWFLLIFSLVGALSGGLRLQHSYQEEQTMRLRTYGTRA